MIANANDDGGNGGPDGLALWVAERRAGGGVRRRLCLLRGPIRFGAAPVPPELLARARPAADDPGDGGGAVRKEGAR